MQVYELFPEDFMVQTRFVNTLTKYSGGLHSNVPDANTHKV